MCNVGQQLFHCDCFHNRAKNAYFGANLHAYARDREMFHNARSLHYVISFTMFYLPVCDLFHKVQWVRL